MRSSGAHCDPDLAKRIDETLGKVDWRDTWQRGLARSLAKRIGETLGEEEKEEEKRRRMSSDKI